MKTRYTATSLCLALLLSTSMHVSAQVCPSSADVATPYNSNNGLKGVMFDLTAPVDGCDVVINCFEVNFAAGTCDPIIYHKAGTHVGFEETPGAWTAIDSLTGLTSAGPDLPTYVPIAVNVAIATGGTHAFYITNRVGPNTKYTDGTTLGDVFAGDTCLVIREGTGVSYPFDFNIQPRKFNGTIYYTKVTTGIGEHLPTGVITLAPNPAVDRIRLGGGGPGATITVTDALGRVALRAMWSTEMDVTALAPGSYVLTVQDAAGRPLGARAFLKQ